MDSLVLLKCATVAESLACELEDDAIDASHLPLWNRYARELEKMIRLAGSGLPADDILARLQASVSIIGTPKSGLF
jgi:hypothetical protein